jgi:hypothetical protein
MAQKSRVTMTQKTRRAFLGTAALTTATGIAGSAGARDDAATISFEESFDASSREWKVAADAEADVEFGSEWTIEVSDTRSFTGDRSLEYLIDATQDLATIWAYTEVDVQRGQSYDVELSTRFWNEGRSYNKLSNYRAYFGPDKPGTLSDFTSSVDSFPVYNQAAGDIENPWEEEGWTEYPLFWQTPELDTDTLYLAFAVQPTWPTTVEHAIDDVSVRMEPR